MGLWMLWLILMILFFWAGIKIDRDTEKKYLKKNLITHQGGGEFTSIGMLLFPQDYFEKKHLKKAYKLFLFGFGLILIGLLFLYLFVKSVVGR